MRKKLIFEIECLDCRFIFDERNIGFQIKKRGRGSSEYQPACPNCGSKNLEKN